LSVGTSPQTPLHGEDYSAPPDPRAVLRGPTSKGRGWERKKRGVRIRGKRGDEKRGSSSFALGRKKKSRRL